MLLSDRGFIMNSHVRRAIAALALVIGPAAAAIAQQPPITAPVPQVVPQFNDPGPQIRIPPPGNPVQQLSPLPSLNPPAGVLGYPSVSGRTHVGYGRAHVKRHRAAR
jgi:hypothetical protein